MKRAGTAYWGAVGLLVLCLLLSWRQPGAEAQAGLPPQHGGLGFGSGVGAVPASSITGTLGVTHGGTGLSSVTEDAVLVGDGGGGQYQAKVLPDCPDSGGNHLNYVQAINTFSCGTSGGGGAAAFNAITGGTNTTAAMVVGAGASLGHTGGGTIDSSSLTGVEGGTATITATSAAVGASAQPGSSVTIDSGDGVAGNVNAGAAQAGEISLTTGNAQRLTSGDANGGSINLLTGTGIGTGVGGSINLQPATGGVINLTGAVNASTNITLASGQMLLPAGSITVPSMAFAGSTTTGWSGISNGLYAVAGGATRVVIDSTGITGASSGVVLGSPSTPANRFRAGYFGGQTLTTTVTPLWDGAVTWNASGTSHRGIKLAVTETADAATSRYFEILGGASGTTDEFYVAKGGLVQAGGLTLTAGTMTAGSLGNLRTATSSYTWTNAQVVAALGGGTTGDITVATLPAKTQVIDAAVVITGAASGPATLTVACGRTGATYIDYIVASDAKAAANTVYGDASAERGTNLTGYDLPSYTGTTDVVCHFVAADTTAVTSSTGSVILTTRLLP